MQKYWTSPDNRADPMTPVITGTSLSPNDREKVIQIVEALGWTFNPHLTSDVTHLVATRVGSEKCTVAKAMRIPIVSISWLEECRQRLRRVLTLYPNMFVLVYGLWLNFSAY
ncbi:twin BRCT domain-containing protein [Chytridium lagenaria]|nr:twin BRCT domain-containing protein [Chytridium lagenaria]